MSLDIFLASPPHLEKKSQCPMPLSCCTCHCMLFTYHSCCPLSLSPLVFKLKPQKPCQTHKLSLGTPYLGCPSSPMDVLGMSPQKKDLATLFFMDLSIVGYYTFILSQNLLSNSPYLVAHLHGQCKLGPPP